MFLSGFFHEEGVHQWERVNRKWWLFNSSLCLTVLQLCPGLVSLPCSLDETRDKMSRDKLVPPYPWDHEHHSSSHYPSASFTLLSLPCLNLPRLSIKTLTTSVLELAVNVLCVCVLRGKREKPLQARWSNRWRTTKIALSSVRNYYPWKGSKDSAEFRLFGLKGHGITISNTTAFEKERWKCVLWVKRGSAEGVCWVMIVTHWDHLVFCILVEKCILLNLTCLRPRYFLCG